MAHVGVAALILSFWLGACGGTVEDGSPSREPERHRSRAAPCTGDAPQGASGPAMPCETDADCGVELPRAHCVLGGGGGYCTYDGCTRDSECDTGMLCECAEGGNAGKCVSSAGCAVDADCPGSYCSPSLGDCGPYSGTVGYFCHTPDDACIDDADCPDGGYCRYQPVAGHWTCGAGSCVG